MASIDLDKVLDKAWADKNLTEILAAPVAALTGVSTCWPSMSDK
ncbi:hypothetical protein ACR6C2_13710 [Streptomyces sp. INA 01156]